MAGNITNQSKQVRQAMPMSSYVYAKIQAFLHSKFTSPIQILDQAENTWLIYYYAVCRSAKCRGVFMKAIKSEMMTDSCLVILHNLSLIKDILHQEKTLRMLDHQAWFSDCL